MITFPSAICAIHGKICSEGHPDRGAVILIHLHKQATTTPKVRAAIQAGDDAGTVLAERFGVTPQTICKWRKRDSVADRSHTAASVADNPDPGARSRRCGAAPGLLVSLGDFLAVVRDFLTPNVSR
jgi:hypothetical protein